jgi:hypothetical protein
MTERRSAFFCIVVESPSLVETRALVVSIQTTRHQNI